MKRSNDSYFALSYVYGLSIFNSHLIQGARIVLYENSVIEKVFKMPERKSNKLWWSALYLSIIDELWGKIITKDLKYVTQRVEK